METKIMVNEHSDDTVLVQVLVDNKWHHIVIVGCTPGYRVSVDNKPVTMPPEFKRWYESLFANGQQEYALHLRDPNAISYYRMLINQV